MGEGDMKAGEREMKETKGGEKEEEILKEEEEGRKQGRGLLRAYHRPDHGL